MFRQPARDARVDHVDDAARRRRAVEQRRRPAQHLDPFGEQRVDDDRMIDRGVRHVERADAVGQHADTLALQAAQDRARGVGTEGGGRDAGLARQRLADRRSGRAVELAAGEHRGAREHIALRAFDERRDDHFLGLIGRAALRFGGRRAVNGRLDMRLLRGGGHGERRQRDAAKHPESQHSTLFVSPESAPATRDGIKYQECALGAGAGDW